ncbi:MULTISPECIES: MobH family relaxase [unclassified Pseudomonas]|uniref:MobH family relaxase n=1 Tax=unclassified Pseudomonas TaxID=196821 RepID=UPI000B686394|nr:MULTISPECIES: MobH family relaxase [unclassified Pseudomonas]SNS89089.1 integrating conjugative element relaxase, PFL_4751 family [Pseudomonas sp. LAMO17WK12:I8]SNY18405.1 integrating conjugative element relaxase, PFL_4751 family [Pseudomonas sp. LAMO17WK12:I12]SNY19321.1 integrating conjugative element relaxase, PFL_4751 family [Pseudomonas sp. LAMO17WK12:I11]SNY19348.1 integrating conjugative element relaxase, PFL_4751 family [Pseudomonas sp. LAMO17WK12:I7]
MKCWWLKFRKGEAAEPTPTPIAQGFLLPQSAESLLAADHRRKLLERIWQYTALSEAQFNRLYLEPIRRYASFVQQLPASESHHHAYPGGMLDHGLELVACSLKLRQSYLLPSGAAPEDQAAQADAWSAAIAYGALLHDIGKIAVDLQVECQNAERWHPWHGPLSQPYRFRYHPGRDYKLHGAAAGLLYTQILSPALLDWLSDYPELWSQLLFLLADHYEHAGTLGELVLQADRVSTAQNIGGNPAKALQAPKHSLQHHLLMGLRHLVKNEFKLNQPGAAGWLTEDHLWLVSKTMTDKLRAHLLAQAVDGIPSSNIALFDELQSHGLVDATPEGKAVWSATVTDEDWQHRFTFLRLQPSLIWADEPRPECFSGAVEPMMDHPLPTGEASESAPDRPQTTPEEKKPAPVPLNQDFDYLEDLMDMLQEPGELEDGPSTGSLQSATAPPQDAVGLAFIEWLREGIHSHRLVVNDSKAKVHTVDGTFFLVTPGIFQRYAAEHPELTESDPNNDAWRRLQRQFEKLEVHVKKPNGQNIWTCKVGGPRKASSLNGYLLSDARTIQGELPANNPFLTLMP